MTDKLTEMGVKDMVIDPGSREIKNALADQIAANATPLTDIEPAPDTGVFDTDDGSVVGLHFRLAAPFAKSVKMARFKWNRIYSMPFQREFHKHVASYFIKDDHDVWQDDCWPGMEADNMHEFTFEQGQAADEDAGGGRAGWSLRGPRERPRHRSRHEARGDHGPRRDRAGEHGRAGG